MDTARRTNTPTTTSALAENVSLDGLRYACAVAELGSFTAAAQRYDVTQPAMSIAVAKLEEHLGGRLFLRTPRGCVASAFGEAVLPRIRQVLVDLDRVAREAQGFGASARDTVRVGVTPQISPSVVADLNEVLAEVEDPGGSAPRTLELDETDIDTLSNDLENGWLDLLLVPSVGPLPEVSHRTIDSDHLVVVDSSPGGDGGGEPVDVSALADRSFILPEGSYGLTKLVQQLFDTVGEKVRAAPVHVDGVGRLAEWAGQGLGDVLLLERDAAAQRLPYHRLRFDTPGERDGAPIFAEIFFEAVWDDSSADAYYLGVLVDKLVERRRIRRDGP